MAIEKTTFPVLTASTWWKLRKKFNSSIPKDLSPGYLAAALDMNESSAKTNVLPKLKLIGLCDDDNKPTDLAIKWRDDSQYSSVCEGMISELYPSELVDAIDDPLNNKDRVVKWFQNKARVGEKAALMMTAFYLLLVESDPSKQNVISSGKSEKPKKTPPTSPEKTIKQSAEQQVTVPKNPDHAEVQYPISKSAFKPSVHLDIQIHISPDSSPETIDKIFESMAKHLSGFKL